MFAPSAINDFIQNSNWQNEPYKQCKLQMLILDSNDVDGAIALLSHIESVPNTEFDVDALFDIVCTHASPEQALNCIQKTIMCPFTKLQKIILNEGSHDQLLKLKNWQLSLLDSNESDHS